MPFVWTENVAVNGLDQVDFSNRTIIACAQERHDQQMPRNTKPKFDDSTVAQASARSSQF
jgi:hypothetical protein